MPVKFTTFEQIDWSAWTPAERATLLFVRRDGQLLLIHKKRGLGAGKINGPGGRIDPGETPAACAVREVQEELLVTPTGVQPAGELFFQFADGYSLHGYVFTATGCDGDPQETDEAVPQWTPEDRIPLRAHVGRRPHLAPSPARRPPLHRPLPLRRRRDARLRPAPRAMSAPARHTIATYYLVGGINSLAATLFTYCSFFWARGTFGFSDEWNLRMGALQGVAAVLSAHFGGRLGDRLGFDRLLKIALPVLVAILLSGAWLHWHWTPLLFTTLYVAVVVSTWPSVEASVLHAPSRLSMPSRLGYYNIVWSATSALGFLLAGWIYRWQPAAILWVPALLHALAWIIVSAPARGATQQGAASAMDLPQSGDALPAAAKRRFLLTALIGNAVAYFIINGFIALAPHVGERLGLTPSQAIWLTCTLLVTRAFAFALFWRWEGWHYRMGWAQLALWTAPACVAGIFFAPSIAVVAALMGLLGVAAGLTYYGSIYYSLEYGEAKGEGGGRHEAVLGLGILAGPLTGAIATGLTGHVEGGKTAILALSLLVTLALTLRYGRQGSAQTTR
jgi:8-oxo-dGTP diphosphatase